MLRPEVQYQFGGELVLGEHGFHGCIDPGQAIALGSGLFACRLELSDTVHNSTYVCGRAMKVLSIANAESRIRDAGLVAVHEALPGSFDGVTLDEPALQALREDVEDRVDALQDGEWALNNGKAVDLERLRNDVEQAQRNARLVDAALRLESDSHERIRSAIEDLRAWGVALDLSLDALEYMPPEEPAVQPNPPGLEIFWPVVAHSFSMLGWIESASRGYRTTDGRDVLFLSTLHAPADPAKRIASVMSTLIKKGEFVVVIDRRAFEISLPLREESIQLSSTKDIDEQHATPLLLQTSAPTKERAAFGPKQVRVDPQRVLKSYFAPQPPPEPEPGPATNIAIRVPILRSPRERPPHQSCAIWGGTFDDIAAEGPGFRPSLWVHSDGVQRVWESKARDDIEAIHDTEKLRALPPALHADLIAPATFTRVEFLGPLGPRRRLRTSAFLGMRRGSIGKFRVWFDNDCRLQSRPLSEMPWLYALWRTNVQDPFTYEALRRSADPDPREHALEIARALSFRELTVGFLESGEWISVGQRASFTTVPERKSRTLVYAFDPSVE